MSEIWRLETHPKAGAVWVHADAQAWLMEVSDAESAGRAMAHARRVRAPAIAVRSRDHAPRDGDPPGALYLEVGGLDALRAVDEESRVVRVQAGIRWQVLERQLRAHRLTLGPMPAWLFDRTVLDSFAADDRLRPSPRYGQLTEATLAVQAALPSGAVTRSAVTPRRATGPDLVRCALGTGLTAGMVVDLHLQVWRYPTQQAVRANSFGGWEAAHDAAARLSRAGVRPAWWCLTRLERRVLLAASIVGEGDLDEQVARYDAVVGGRAEPASLALGMDADCFPPLDAVGGARPLYAVAAARRGELAEAVKGRHGAQVWDLRPEGATIYAAAPAPRRAATEWATAQATLVRALEGR